MYFLDFILKFPFGTAFPLKFPGKAVFPLRFPGSVAPSAPGIMQPWPDDQNLPPSGISPTYSTESETAIFVQLNHPNPTFQSTSSQLESPSKPNLKANLKQTFCHRSPSKQASAFLLGPQPDCTAECLMWSS